MKSFAACLLLTCLVAAPSAWAAKPQAGSVYFPDKLTPTGKLYLKQCSDRQIELSANPKLRKRECRGLYRDWLAEAGAPKRRRTPGMLTPIFPYDASPGLGPANFSPP